MKKIMKLPESFSASNVAEVMTTRRDGRKPLAAFTSPNKMSVLMDLEPNIKEEIKQK